MIGAGSRLSQARAKRDKPQTERREGLAGVARTCAGAFYSRGPWALQEE